MEQGSLIGLIMVMIGVFVGAILKGVQVGFLFSVPAAFLIVFVGAFGAAFLSNPMARVKGTGKIIGIAFKGPAKHEVGETVSQVVSFADRARREGLLSLEDECQKIEDPFLRKGLQMAIDGADPEQVREVLELEVEALKERHKGNAQMMQQIGVFAPTFGIIGAVFGLIVTLSHMDDPKLLAEGISAAFVATFWGVFLANGLFLPWSNKLTALSAKEVAYKRLIVEGVLAIQGGANPRMLDDMLRATLPPKERGGAEERKSA
jgi:chemotaxis protein MotA